MISNIDYVTQFIMLVAGTIALIAVRNSIKNKAHKGNNNTLVLLGFACSFFCPLLFFVGFYLQTTVD